MPDNSTAVAARANPLVQFREQLEQRAAEFKMALPSHISADKFQRTLLTAVQQNPDLLVADRRSFLLACMRAAHSGLLPDGREAVLVVFKTRKKINGQWQSVDEVVFIEMVYGVRKKILQARDAAGKPVVSDLDTNVVYRREYEEGHFYYEVGKFPPLGHRPMLELTADDTKDENIIGAYSIATMADGTRSYKFLRRFQIDKIRETSKTGATRNRDGTPRTPSGPWVEWLPAQCEKTALKQHSKSLPQSGDLIFDADDDEGYSTISAAAVLAIPGGEPSLITDDSGDTIDQTTGEVVSEGNADAGGGTESSTAQPKAEQENGPTASTAKAEPTASQSSGSDDSDDDPDTHPGRDVAEKLIEAMSKAANVPAVQKIYDGAVMDLPFMLEVHSKAVESSYSTNLKRLGTTPEKVAAVLKKQPETVK